jgi:hypothetical protein
MKMLIQNKQIVNIQLATEALAEKRIEPPKEGPVVDTAGGLGRVRPILGSQQAALVDGFKNEDNELDHDGGNRNGCNGIA